MDMATVLQEIDSWPVEDRIRLVQAVWDRLVDVGAHPEVTEAQKADLDRRLAALEANPNDVVQRTGLTAVIIASAMARIEAVTLLLDAGANPNAADANGFTALHRAVRGEADRGVDPILRASAPAIVSALLAHGADVKARDDRGVTPLMSACLAHGAQSALPDRAAIEAAVARLPD